MLTRTKKAIEGSRSSGTCNLSSHELEEVPVQVYDPSVELPATPATAGAVQEVKWWEMAELTRLILSHNMLAALPHGLSQISSLLVIDAAHNRISSVPAELCTLPALKLLDVSHNALEALPEELAQCSALVKLACDHNSLSRLPLDLGAHQPQLAQLSAGHNALTGLPAGLGASLTALDVRHNALAALDPQLLGAMSGLTQLVMSSNRIAGGLPPALGRLAHLRILDVTSNRVTGLPAEIAQCTALVELLLAENALTGLPDGLGGLKGLKTLDVRCNHLVALPHDLCRNGVLSLLDVSSNLLTAVQPELSLMTTLRALRLEGNPIRAIPSSVLSGPLSGLMRALRNKLPREEEGAPLHGADVTGGRQRTTPLAVSAGGAVDLSNSQLTAVPVEVYEAQPSRVDLSDNRLTEVELHRFTGAASICLRKNQIARWPLPDGVGSLSALRALDLGGNAFPALGSFAACPGLSTLLLSGICCGGSLDGSSLVRELPCLELLDMSSSQLTGFPAALCGLPSLSTLRLAGNRIESLPVELTQLSALTELDVTNNDLRSLPPKLGLMEGSLRVLKLEGNQLGRTIRRPVLDRGTAAVLAYLKDRIPL